jgi:hypothetical protein
VRFRRLCRTLFHHVRHISSLSHTPAACSRPPAGVDYPYAPNASGRAFLDRLALAPADMAKLAHGNADALLGLKVADKTG